MDGYYTAVLIGGPRDGERIAIMTVLPDIKFESLREPIGREIVNSEAAIAPLKTVATRYSLQFDSDGNPKRDGDGCTVYAYSGYEYTTT